MGHYFLHIHIVLESVPFKKLLPTEHFSRMPCPDPEKCCGSKLFKKRYKANVFIFSMVSQTYFLCIDR